MKALSLWQPWASLLVAGHKRVETRSRRLPLAPGRILIHAARKWSPLQAAVCLREPYASALREMGYDPEAEALRPSVNPEAWSGDPPALPGGCVVGEVTLVRQFDTRHVNCFEQAAFPRNDPPRVQRVDADDWLFVSGVEWEFGDFSSPGRTAALLADPLRYPVPVYRPGCMYPWEVSDREVSAIRAKQAAAPASTA